MIGVVDVGGGLRGSYGAGVLDYCLDYGIQFDYGIGVSAGSANICSYVAKQRGRNYVFYMEYMKRQEYLGLKALLKTGSYIGLDYIYSDLSDSDGEYPIDYETMVDNPMQLTVVTTDAETGLPVYFTKNDMSKDHYDIIKASCNVPVVDRPFMIDGVPYYDGGLSDPIPFEKAFKDGCNQVVIILTRPKDFRRKSKSDETIAKLLTIKYPNAASALEDRAKTYNTQLEQAIELEKEGKIFIVAPENIGHMKTLTKDTNAIRELYLRGYRDGKRIKEFMHK